MKNFLVTGASKGLGLEITKSLLANGHAVYAVSRTSKQELGDLKQEFHNNLYLLDFDLKDTDSIKRQVFCKDFISFDTPIHGFVNNAAKAYDDIVTNADVEQIKDMYDINVFTPMILTKYAIRHMLLHKIEGSIVHISSISVHTGYKGLSMYASTKGALEAFSKNTAREWGSRKIRSNAIVAGFMETNMSSTLDAEQKNRIYKRTSLKEATEPKSVAAMVNFLLSDASRSITGQSFFVDSGTI